VNILKHLSAQNPASALVFPDHTVSYGELARCVDAMAQRMAGARRLVALETQPGKDLIVSYLAARNIPSRLHPRDHLRVHWAGVAHDRERNTRQTPDPP
jgi:hypothetical protein